MVSQTAGGTGPAPLRPAGLASPPTTRLCDKEDQGRQDAADSRIDTTKAGTAAPGKLVGLAPGVEDVADPLARQRRSDRRVGLAARPQRHRLDRGAPPVQEAKPCAPVRLAALALTKTSGAGPG
jgi:hypothetical protein